MKQKLRDLLTLFITFFRIGITTFGGGYAMIPIVQDTVVEKKKWIDEKEMIKVLAISEATPGPIAINMATFIGYKVLGVVGSIFATLGVVLPSFIIILAISLFLNNLMEYELVVSIFKGVRCAVAVLMITAGIKMFVKMEKNIYSIIVFVIFAIVLVLINVFSWNFSTVYLILAGLVLGVVSVALTSNKNKIQNEKTTKNKNTLPQNEKNDNSEDQK